jgi:hypothetical protein
MKAVAKKERERARQERQRAEQSHGAGSMQRSSDEHVSS